MSLREFKFQLRGLTGVETADVTTIDLGDVGAADTFTLTPTRVDTGTAGTATGAIAWDATNATTASNAQTAIQALGGIYADATVAAGAAETYVITMGAAGAGYDITWEVTDPTTFTPGSTVETTPGKTTYTGVLEVGGGKYVDVKRLAVKNIPDASLDLSIVDSGSRTVFVDTAVDVDADLVKQLCVDGLAAEDGAATAGTNSGIFDGPFTVTIASSAPFSDADLNDAYVSLVCRTPGSSAAKRFLKRSTGAFSAASTTLNLGADFVVVRRIKLESSADESVAPTLTDADGFTVYTKTSTDYVPAIEGQLATEGLDEDGNAVADLLDVVAASPITVAQTGLGSGTFKVDLIVEP